MTTQLVEEGRTNEPAKSPRCRSLLVVEDDVDVRETLQMALEAQGYDVRVAVNGKDALTQLNGRVEQPCLILLDLMMPVMSGEELLSALREDDILAPIPVVIVSAVERDAPTLAEAQGFVRKPVDLESLLAWVARYC